MAEQGGALAADGVHHGAHVVHPLLERRHAADPVGGARAALVEADDAHPPGQLVEAGTDRVVVELDRRKVEAHREDDVARAFAEDAVGDVDVAAPRVPGVRAHTLSRTTRSTSRRCIPASASRGTCRRRRMATSARTSTRRPFRLLPSEASELSLGSLTQSARREARPCARVSRPGTRRDPRPS